MTAPTPYEPPDGHILMPIDGTDADVPDDWEIAKVLYELRLVRQPDPAHMAHYVIGGCPQWVTSVGQMRGRTDLDQWEYASSAWRGRWVAWEDFGGPEDFPVVVRRRVK